MVLGYLVRGPMGGIAWHYLQYVMGLAALGHDVYYLEDADDYASCYDPRTGTMTTDPAAGLDFARDAFDRIGFGGRWGYYDSHTGHWMGPLADRATAICKSADLVLNVSAVNPLRPWLAEVPVRVFIDTDPAFTQIQHLTHPDRLAIARDHSVFLTFGENVPGGASDVPPDGLPWQATRQPIVLEAWPVMPSPPQAPFTTVMKWNSYPPMEYAGRRYGMKSLSFVDYVDLPHRTAAAFELACSPGDPDALRARGWRLCDPASVSADPWLYRHYIQQSLAEFSVAKHGYVAARTGWFSERSAAYLASGRPVVVQDTGFTQWLEAAAGVLPFSTADEAADAVARVIGDYARHCRAARQVAADLFDARAVLTSLLDRALAPAPSSAFTK